MYKHALMLTVAAVALTAGSAAQATTPITTTVKTAQKTSTAGGTGGADNIILGDSTASPVKDGYVTVTIASPAVTIDTANYVKIATASSTISNIGTTSAIGVQLDATSTGNGPGSAALLGSEPDALYSIGKIDLTGSGSSKTGILVSSDSSANPVFYGNINLDTGSSLSVTGDNSSGILTTAGTTLDGNITILGNILVNPTTAGAITGGAVHGVALNGTMNGNFLVGTGGVIDAFGAGANAIDIAGALNGSFVNNGSITASGAVTPNSVVQNPQASSAIIIANSIDGGFYNAGPLTTGTTTTRASILTGGNAAAIDITSGTTALTIAPYAGTLGGTYSFVNRGSIQAAPLNADLSGAMGINIGGNQAAQVTFAGGIWNAGAITATATTDAKSSQAVIAATAININDWVSIPSLYNDAKESGGGTISAVVAGAFSAQANAIVINGSNSSLPSITNTGTILAKATSTDNTVSSLTAYAINDLSGTLTRIDNFGTISATTSALANNQQKAVALYLGLAKSAVTITNTDTIAGDLYLGSNGNTITVTGNSAQAASITGNIYFGGGGTDILTINDYSTVTGAITERGGGHVDVTVGIPAGGTGTLTLTNTTANLQVGKLDVLNGGSLGLDVSQYFNSTTANYVGPIITANNEITLAPTSKFNLSFQSFISTPNVGQSADFVLLDAPTGALTVANFAAIKTTVEGNAANNVAGEIPYLFTGDICTYHVGATDCTNAVPASAASRSQLVLQLQPKTAAQIGLSGNAAKIFNYANTALATDNTLGGAFVSDITNATQAQNAYEAFVPDVSGSSRAVLVSITDQATGPVAARQRELRTYANMPGETTLWGQEFFQRINSGTNVDGYRGSGFGFALGADKGGPDNGRYGAAFTFFSGDQTNKGANFQKTSNQWYMLTGYTDWRGKGMFLDTQLGFGYGALNGRRFITLTDPNNSANIFKREATNKHNGLTLTGGFSTGAVLTYGGTVITPQVSFDGLALREEGYTESGGGSGVTGQDGLDLIVKPYYANSARGYIGTTVREDINFDSFFLQPEVRAGYRYDFLASPVKLKAAFASVPNSLFTLTGPDPEKGNVVAGATLAVSTGTWSLGVNYDYLHGTQGATDQMGTVTLLGRF